MQARKWVARSSLNIKRTSCARSFIPYSHCFPPSFPAEPHSKHSFFLTHFPLCATSNDSYIL
ncbi:hypothetical protein I7I48_07107 [Histoplasma ohiense]|nr:hypothetical protein I7I48_07107 [Histoplasma ohiense (nom. inval.)]